MSIKTNLNNIKSTLPNHVTLVAVSKTKPISDIMEAYHAGHRVFGENKIQEMVEKQEAMPKDIDWTGLSEFELDDTTKGSQTMACSGNVCEIVDLT